MSFITKTPENLAAVKERLELVLSCANVGMWDWNPQTNEVVFDDRWAEMLGLVPSELTQTLDDWSLRVHPNDLQSCFDDIADHIEGRSPTYANTHRMRHKNGSWVYILNQGRVTERDAKGRPIRFTGTHTDVTAIIESQRKATEALEMRDLFFAQISHDIRTPLHGILGAVSVLEAFDSDEQTHKLLSMVRKSSNKLARLIDDILDISKICAGGIEPKMETTDILQTVRQSFDQHRALAHDKGLEFILTEQLSLPPYCETDDLRLSQILDNLISNAIKYTEQGRVNVIVEGFSNGISIQVKDTGLGIKDIKRAFENYSRETILNAKGSTGLGLGIVKMLSDVLGIGLTVESTAGKGTCFTLLLTQLSDQQNVADLQARQSEIKGLQRKNSSQKCLLVDDDDVNIMVGQFLLEKYFDHVVVAKNGKEALELVGKDNSFDALFVDLNLPDMRGEQLVEAIQKIFLNPPKIICQSAEAEFSNMISECGFDAFLAKPYGKNDVDQLLRKLNLH